MSNKMIVIAEDDLTSRMLLVSGVEKSGYTAVQCVDGAMAWQLLQANPGVVMLITDVMMPKLDGRELVRRIRENEKMRDLPILIVSGAISPKEIASLLDDGATAFLPKPVSLGEVQEYIGKNL